MAPPLWHSPYSVFFFFSCGAPRLFLCITKHVSASVYHFWCAHVWTLIFFSRMNKKLVGLDQHGWVRLFTLVRFRFKTILIYICVFTAFQKRSPSKLHNRKCRSLDISCRYNNGPDFVYTVVNDMQRKCWQPHHQKSLFWYIYTEMQPWSFLTKTGFAAFSKVSSWGLKRWSSVN